MLRFFERKIIQPAPNLTVLQESGLPPEQMLLLLQYVVDWNGPKIVCIINSKTETGIDP